MEAQLGDPQLASRDPIDQAVFCGDASRPVAAQGVLERLGFTDPAIWIPHCILYEQVDPFQRPRISFLPVEIFFPRVPRENEIHASSFNFFRITLPHSSDLIDRKRRFAFAGDRNRCAVSCSDSYSASDNITTA